MARTLDQQPDGWRHDASLSSISICRSGWLPPQFSPPASLWRRGILVVAGSGRGVAAGSILPRLHLADAWPALGFTAANSLQRSQRIQYAQSLVMRHLLSTDATDRHRQPAPLRYRT